MGFYGVEWAFEQSRGLMVIELSVEWRRRRLAAITAAAAAAAAAGRPAHDGAMRPLNSISGARQPPGTPLASEESWLKTS